jgi:hypothetical protein
MVLTFDQALTPAILSLLPWTLRHNNLQWNCAFARAGLPASNQIEANWSVTANPKPPGTAVNYTPPPADVTNLADTPATLFANFSLAVV